MPILNTVYKVLQIKINKMNRCEHNEKINLFCASQHCEHKQAGGCQQCIKKYHNHITNTKYLTQAQLLQILKKFTNIDHSYKLNCRSIQQGIYAYFNSLKQQISNSIELICKTVITQLGSPYMYQKNIFSVYKRLKNNQWKRIYVKDLRKFVQLSKTAPSVKQISKQEGKLYKQYLKRIQKFISSFQQMISNQYEICIRQWIQNYKHDKTTFDPLSKLIKQTLIEGGKSGILEVNIEKQLEKAKLRNGALISEYEKNEKEFKGPIKNNDSNYLKTNQTNRLPSYSKQKNYHSQITKQSGLSLISSFPSHQQTNHKFGVKDFSAIQKGQSISKLKNTKNAVGHKRQISLDKKINLGSNQTNYNSVGNNNGLKSSEKRRKGLDNLLDDYKVQAKQHKIHEDQKKQVIILPQFPTQSSSSRRKTEDQNSSSSSLQKNHSKQKQINMRKQQLMQMMKNNSAVVKINHSTQKKTDILNLQTKQSKKQFKNYGLVQKKLNQQKLIQKDSPPFKQRISPSILSDFQQKSSPIQEISKKLYRQSQTTKNSLKNQSSILFTTLTDSKNTTNNTQSRQLSGRKNLSVVIQDKKGIQQCRQQISKQKYDLRSEEFHGKQSIMKNKSDLKDSPLLKVQNQLQIKPAKSIQKIILQQQSSSGSIKVIQHSKKHQITLAPQLIGQIVNAKGNMNAHSKLPIEDMQQKQKQIGCSRLIIVPTPQKINLVEPYDCESPLIKKKGSLKPNSKQKQKEKTEINKYRNQHQKNFQQQKSQKEKSLILKQNEQKSLNLLLKSIHSKPYEAINFLQQALKQAPNNLSAAEYLSFLYLQNNKPRQALNVCNTILQRFLITNQNKQSEQLLLSLQINKSAALNMLGRWSQTIILLQRCLKQRQTFNSHLNGCQHLMFKNLGDAYHFNSNYQKAIFYYQKAIKLNYAYDEAYYNMAVCLYLQNNFHNAKMAIQKAIDINQNEQYIELNKQISNRLNKLQDLR